MHKINTEQPDILPTIGFYLFKNLMRKQPVMNELSKLRHYIKRFCPELSTVKLSRDKYTTLSDQEQEKLIEQYISNIKALSTEDNWTN